MLSKIFGKTITLELEELSDFLESNSDKKLAKINEKIHDILSKNNRIIENINYLLETISCYNINKEKLGDIEFKLVKASIDTIHNETKQIITIVNEEMDHLKLKEQTEKFKKKYEHLKIELKDHLRKIEPHFKDLIIPFLEKMRDLSDNIKSIEDILKNKSIEEYYLMLSEIEKLNQIFPDKKITKDLSKTKSSIMKLSVRLSALQDKKETMMFTDQFKMSKKTYESTKEIKENISLLKEDVDDMFRNIKPLLSLYNKKFYSRILNNYIQSPSDGLINDKNLEIIDLLKKIQEKIRDEKIKITKNKEEIMSSIKSITKVKLKAKKQKLEKLESDYQRKKVLLTKNKIMLDILELDYQMDHLKTKMKKYEDELKSQEPLDETESSNIIIQLTKKIKDFTGKKIKVKDAYS